MHINRIYRNYSYTSKIAIIGTKRKQRKGYSSSDIAAIMVLSLMAENERKRMMLEAEQEKKRRQQDAEPEEKRSAEESKHE